MRALPNQPSTSSSQIHNEAGTHRVLVTKPLPGDRWLALLTGAGARVEVCTAKDTILSVAQIRGLIGAKCDGVIGQLTEVRDDWGRERERDRDRGRTRWLCVLIVGG